MTQPTPYDPSADFTEFDLGLIGEALNTEFVDLRLTTDEILRSIVNMQRDDYGLKNQSVHIETLGSDVIAYLAKFAGATWIPRGNWLTGTVYAVGDLVSQGGVTYVAALAHTSGTFATDLAAGKWVALNTAPPEVSDTLLGVASVAALRAYPATSHGQTVLLNGYYATGDAPSRVMWWDAFSVAADDGGRFFQVTGVVIGRWRSSIVDHMDIRLWGAKLDNVTDDYDAWNRALNPVNPLRIDTVFFNTKIAGTILFADVGKSYCSQTLQCKSQFSLIGSGGHIGNMTNCCIRFPVNTSGIQINSFNTLGDATVAYGSGADGSVIDGIALQGPYFPDFTGTIGRGIRLRGRAILRNMNIQGFAQEGVYIRAFAGGGGDLEGNVNNWYMDNIRSQNNGGDGFFVDGADANAGVGTALQGSTNQGHGIYESSFLGNCWIQCLTESNALSGYKSDSAAASTFLSPYAEGDQPNDEFDAATLVLGGIVTEDKTLLGIRLYPAGGFLINYRGYESQMETAGGAAVDVRLGGAPDNGDILAFTHETYAPLTCRLMFDATFGGNLAWTYSNSIGSSPCQFTLPTTTLAFGRSAPVPHAFTSSKIFTGFGSFGRLLTHYAGPPAGENAGVGDCVFSPTVVAGGSMGIVCTTAGVNGSTAVYKAMPNVAA